MSYDRGNKKDKYFGDGTHFVTGHTGKKVFEPAVDMFTLVGAKLFVGNMLSTFSTNVANIRQNRLFHITNTINGAALTRLVLNPFTTKVKKHPRISLGQTFS